MLVIPILVVLLGIGYILLKLYNKASEESKPVSQDRFAPQNLVEVAEEYNIVPEKWTEMKKHADSEA